MVITRTKYSKTDDDTPTAPKSGNGGVSSKKIFEHNILPDVRKYTTLIYGLSEKGKIDKAKQLMNEMKQNNISPNIITYNTLIDGLSKQGKFEEAKQLMNEMKQYNISPNVRT